MVAKIHNTTTGTVATEEFKMWQEGSVTHIKYPCEVVLSVADWHIYIPNTENLA